MKIFIQARKDGYNVLYPKYPEPTPPEFYSFAYDIQSTSAGDQSYFYGKQVYSIAFANGGCIFTKYVIGYDTMRNHLGNIGISVFIPNTQKLSGVEAKKLLDELTATYRQNYWRDHKIQNHNEDWSLFTSHANIYDSKLNSVADDETLSSGSTDAAFVYYKDDSELQKYFDAPYQEEYCEFRQVLFVEEDLRGKPGNPLNALRHSGNDLTGKIDLENPKYKLWEFYNKGENEVEIKIKNSKGRECSNKDKIERKEELTIIYSKKYYIDKLIIGSLFTDEEVRKHLLVNKNDKKIDVVKKIELQPETKDIRFDVFIKKDTTKITDAEIKIDTQPWQKITEYTFKAEEIGIEHKISARKGNLSSDIVKITPEKFTEDTLPLPLIEKKVAKTVVTEAEGGKNNIQDFKVYVDGIEKTSELTFIDDEIDNDWNITVEKKGYIRSELKYYPKNDGDTIRFELKKAVQTTLVVTSPSNNGKKDSEPFYKTTKFIATCVVGVLVLGVGILYHFLGNKNTHKEIPLTKEIITAYVEGDLLMSDKLNKYKGNWQEQENNFIVKSGGGWFGSNETTDSAKWRNEWKPVSDSIDRAIKKRDLIKDGNFAELKNQHYSTAQQAFKTAIENIDSTKYTDVSQQLGDVSKLTLTQIAEKIKLVQTEDEIINYLQTADNFEEDKINKYHHVKGLSSELNESLKLIIDFLNDFQKRETFKDKAKNDKFLKQNTHLKKWVNSICKEDPTTKQGSSTPASSEPKTTPASNNAANVKRDLQSSAIEISKLDEYEEYQVYQNSIKLYKDFWKKVKNSNQKEDFDDLLKDVKKDDVLKNSELQKFINEICASTDAFKKYKNVSGKANCKSLNELKNKVK